MFQMEQSSSDNCSSKQLYLSRKENVNEQSSVHNWGHSIIKKYLPKPISDKIRSFTLNPVVDSSKCSTIAAVFNFIYRANRMPNDNQQYKTEDIQTSKNRLLKFSQENFFFHSAIHSS